MEDHAVADCARFHDAGTDFMRTQCRVCKRHKPTWHYPTGARWRRILALSSPAWPRFGLVCDHCRAFVLLTAENDTNP